MATDKDEKAVLLKETKSNILSLLISSTTAMTGRDLLRDYRQMMGESIPFYKLGYNNYFNFLSSISDILQVVGENEWAILTPVVNEKQQYINKFVTRQRVPISLKGNKKNRRPAGIYVQHSNTHHPKRSSGSNVETWNENLYEYEDIYDENDQTEYENIYDENDQTKSKNVFHNNTSCSNRENSHNEGNVHQIQEHSHYEISANVNCKRDANIQFNYDINAPLTEMEFPEEDISQKCILEELEEVKNILMCSLISSCKEVIGTDLLRAYKIETNRDIPLAAFGYKSYYEFLLSIPDVLKVEGFSEKSPVVLVVNAKREKMNYRVMQHVSGKYVQNRRCLGIRLDKSKNVYSYIGTFNASEDEKKRVLSSPRERSSRIIDYEYKYENDGNIFLRNRLEEIVLKYPNGILLEELGALYTKFFNEELYPRDYGYTSICNMFLAFTQIFNVIQQNHGSYKVFHKKCKTNTNSLSQTKDYSRTFYEHDRGNFSLDEAFFSAAEMFEQYGRKNYPLQVLKIGDKIPVLPIPVLNSEFSFFITCVYDPFEFYVRPANKEESMLYLRDQLQSFYSRNHEDFCVDVQHVVADQYCVVKDENGFYQRAIIQKVNGSSRKAKLFLLDVGKSVQQRYSDLFYLHKNFEYLPQSIFRARLSGITYTQPHSWWPAKAIIRFCQLVNGLELSGRVEAVNNKFQVIDLLVHRDHKFDVNNLLCIENFAVSTVNGD